MGDFFKSLLSSEAAYRSLLLVLVAVTAFGLGRHSTSGEGGSTARANVALGAVELPVIEPPASAERVVKVPTVANGTPVVASRSGTKYHLPSCPGAAQIKPENKIHFNSPAEAEAAGYSPAANCKGLQ